MEHETPTQNTCQTSTQHVDKAPRGHRLGTYEPEVMAMVNVSAISVETMLQYLRGACRHDLNMRWLKDAEHQLQQGFMSLRRAITDEPGL